MYKIKVLLYLLIHFTPPSTTQDLSVISNMVNRFRWVKRLMPEIRHPPSWQRSYGYDRQEDITGRNATAACYVCGLDEIAIPYNDTCWTWFTEPDDYTMKFKKETYMRYCYRNESMVIIVANATTGIPRHWERELEQILKLTEKENIKTKEDVIESDDSEGDKHDDRQDVPSTISTINDQVYPTMYSNDPYLRNTMGREVSKEDANPDYSDQALKYVQLMQHRHKLAKKEQDIEDNEKPSMDVYSRQFEALRPGRHPTYIYSNFTGGCFSRWVDLNGIYTQRGCRIKDKPMKGKSIISKRLRLLELTLINETNACVQSPMAVLTPFSRSISLYATYHACVCSEPWCNHAPSNPSFGLLGLIIGNYFILLLK